MLKSPQRQLQLTKMSDIYSQFLGIFSLKEKEGYKLTHLVTIGIFLKVIYERFKKKKFLPMQSTILNVLKGMLICCMEIQPHILDSQLFPGCLNYD